MAGPWEKYGQSAGPTTVGTPRVDPFKVRDQQLQEEAAGRAREDQQFQRQKFGVEMKLKERELTQGAKDPKVTEGERQAAAFYRRAVNAHRQYGEGVLPRNPVAQTAIDILPDSWENSINSPERRAAENYADEFIRAKLRKESGAAIGVDEIAKEYRVYFPVPGDGPEDLKRKAALREQAIEGLRLQAGSEAGHALDGLGTPAATSKRLSPEQQQEFFGILESKGPDSADAYLRQHGLSLKSKEDAANPHSRVIQYDQGAVDNLKKADGQAGITDLLRQGATLGLGDEAAGVGNAIANAVVAPFSDRVDFDPSGSYQAGKQAELQRLAEARQRLGWGGTAAEIGGSLASGNVSNALAVAPSLVGRMAQGMRAGAAGGGVAGFGYGEGQNSLLSAGIGAAGGAALGAAIPVAGQFVGDRVQAVRRLTGRDPDLPRNIVGEAMTADGLSPAQAGAQMDAAHGRGSPMMLADTGENQRQLLASVGRQPGPSRTITKTAVIERQNGQAERIGEAVARDLGPTANIRDMGDELIDRARKAAGPMYEKAYARPGASVVKVDDLATRPSFQKALKKALGTAQEEGVDPTSLGFRFNEAGEPTLDRDALSWQYLDRVKQGLDDVVEGYRNPLTGKLDLNTSEARATNATLRTLINRMDKINPDYAAARAAYAGPARMREALEKGVKALTKSPDDIMAVMKNMGEGEQDAFRLGVRKAIVDLVGTKKDGGDKVSALLGTPKSRAALSRIFGGKAKFERFVQTLRDEEVMGHTYKAVSGNSMTAERSAQDAATGDSGLADAIVGAAATGNPTGLIASAVQKLRSVNKFGAGEAGQRTRESVAALLTETDPALLRELIREAQRAAARQQSLAVRRGKNVVRTGRNAGNLTGMGAGSLQKPQER